ncbi:MAG: agmatinase family protein [Desulfovibrio sp.]|jgi:agmatinase|nr:agmatinase family protein [Desulfovibrio sp.]
MTKTARFLESELEELPARQCRFQVIPVPFEASVSYGRGAARGPAAILEASSQLEVWTGRCIPSREGIYTWPSVEVEGGPEDVLARIEEAVARAVSSAAAPVPDNSSLGSALLRQKADPLPILLGGEHTVSLGALRALKKFYGDFGIIQFDAHADLRSSYAGSAYSHACVMRRAIEDLGLPLFQIGVRSLSLDEEILRAEGNIPHLDARELHSGAWSSPAPAHFSSASAPPGLSLLPPSFPDIVYLSFDIDALDASLMPATGTPEPGGLFWFQALDLVERALAGRVCLGFDVVELAPIPGMHAPNYTAARLVHEIMGIIG